MATATKKKTKAKTKEKPQADEAPRIWVNPADLIDSPLQPRKTYVKAEIEEIASTMKTIGVLENLVGREVGDGLIELVFGHKRKRAALIAGLAAVPVEVRPFTDREARLAQLVENSARSNPHPIEECESYVALIGDGMSAEEIAASLGLANVGRVYRRLGLANLVQEVKDACLAGDVRVGVAEVIARIPHQDLQLEALEEVLNFDEWDGPWTTTQASAHVQRHYMLRLSLAPFETEEELGEISVCSACPKRTGSTPSLFLDVPIDDTCTDTKCFKEKTRLSNSKKLDKAKAEGREVIEDQELLAKMFPYTGGRVVEQSGYRDLDGHCRWNKGEKQTWREVLGDKAPVGAMVVDPDGQVHEVVTDEVLRMVAKAAKVPVIGGPPSKPAGTKKKRSEMSAAEMRAADEAAEARRLERVAKRIDQRTKAVFMGALVDSAGALPQSDWNLFMVSRLVVCAWHDTLKAVCVRRELEVDNSKSTFEKVIIKHAKTLDQKGLRSLLFELTTKDVGYGYSWGSAVKTLKVDRKKIHARIQKEVEAEELAKLPAGTGLVHIRDKQAETDGSGIIKTVCKTKAKLFQHRTLKTARKDIAKITCKSCRIYASGKPAARPAPKTKKQTKPGAEFSLDNPKARPKAKTKTKRRKAKKA